jgi:hypothetical protein
MNMVQILTIIFGSLAFILGNLSLMIQAFTYIFLILAFISTILAVLFGTLSMYLMGD